MYDFIASSFFQKKTCHLPGIGKLSFVATAAETDIINAQIKAPQEAIIFTQTDRDEQIFNEFSAISEMMQRQLTELGLLEISGIGTFTKDKTDIIHLIPIEINPVFIQSVSAISVKRPDIEQAILVGDTENINTSISENSEEENSEEENTADKKANWWIMAILLALIGISIIAFYMYNVGFGNLGNCTPM
jgi:hypothetical protein